MKQTKKDLQDIIINLRSDLASKEKELSMQKEIVKIHQIMQPTSMTIALEKVTEALAHVIYDLKTFRR